MAKHPNQKIDIEPERYEIFAGPTYHFELGRREFLKLLGTGLLVTLAAPSYSQGQQQGGRASESRVPRMLNSRIHIGKDGWVTVMTGKVEVGQDIRTALTLAVAEELRIAPAKVRLIMGDTDGVPDDGPTYGSRTIPRTLPVVRQACVAAREYLLNLAASKWGVDPAILVAADGRVKNPENGSAAAYGELVQGRKMTEKIGEVTLVSPDRWKIAGRSLHKVNGREIVIGKHQYPSDIRRDGMLYGKVLRAPAIGSKLLTVDTSTAQAMPGVTVVHDGDFVGVTAPRADLAKKALESIQATWSTQPQTNDREIYDYLRSNKPKGDGDQVEEGLRFRPSERGSVEEALSQSAYKQQATYTVAYIAHVPLEPRIAVAEWSDGRLTVWTGTQAPFMVRDELAEALRIPRERIRVIMPDTGSAYGGKHRGDAAVEAGKIALKAARPVKVSWTREEEFTWAYFRPAGVIDVKAGVTKEGSLIAWAITNYNSGTSGLNSPWYDVPHVRTAYQLGASPLRQGSYRALAATANHFAREAHMDDLARLAGLDPLTFRIKNSKDERLKAILERTAERFGWGQKSSATRGYGLACGFEKGGYVACCAEVEVNKQGGAVRVVRLTEGFECGAVVNPNLLRSQVLGCVIQGLGGALFEEVKFENGKILTNRFSNYRLPRFSDVPPIDVLLTDRKDIPSAGAGETPIVAVAPAIRNAIMAATGISLRSLPLRFDQLKA